MTVAFVDTETTGLDPDRHEIWEIGLIVDGAELRWMLPVDLGRADPIALRIGRFHERHPQGYHFSEGSAIANSEPSACTPVAEVASAFAAFTQGRHLVGAVISFDEERLRKLLRANGACPEWHYHLIDVEALAVGYLAGLSTAPPTPLPWKSEELSRAVGVNPDEFDKHTALGDARWAKAIYEAVVGA